MNQIILIQAATFLLFIFSLGLGVYTLYANPKSRVNQLWFFLSLAISAWAGLYLILIWSNNRSDAFNFNLIRVLYLAVSFIPVLFFHFISRFLFLHVQYKFLIAVGYLVAIFMGLVAVGTKYIIEGVRYLEGFGVYEDIVMPGFGIFLTYFAFFTFFAILLLIWKWFKSDGIRRRQIGFILLAALFGFVGGATNFMTDLYGFYPYGQMVVWLYPALITYGIFLTPR